MVLKQKINSRLKNIITKSFVLIAVMVIGVACTWRSDGRGYVPRYAKTIPMDMLLKDSAFNFETGHNHKQYAIDLIVRHSRLYKYSHVPLVIKMTVNNNACAIDTVSLVLAKNNDPNTNHEEWLGDSFADYVSFTVPYREGIVIKEYSKVKMTIKPLMPDKYAKGIQFIGVSVTNALYPENK